MSERIYGYGITCCLRDCSLVSRVSFIVRIFWDWRLMLEAYTKAFIRRLGDYDHPKTRRVVCEMSKV